MIITVKIKYAHAMIGTMMSKTFTVAFFRSTIIAARTTRMMVVASGGMENAFSKAEVTELLIT